MICRTGPLKVNNTNYCLFFMDWFLQSTLCKKTDIFSWSQLMQKMKFDPLLLFCAKKAPRFGNLRLQQKYFCNTHFIYPTHTSFDKIMIRYLYYRAKNKGLLSYILLFPISPQLLTKPEACRSCIISRNQNTEKGYIEMIEMTKSLV